MDELLAKLKTLLGDDAKATEALEKAKAEGVTDLETAALATEADWIGYGVPKMSARKLVGELKQATAPAPAAPAVAPVAAATLLPSLPTDDAFLEALRVGGTLKSAPTDVLSAVRAVLASRLGIFDIEDRILEAIEERAEGLGEPVPDIFYDLEKAKGKKAHADVLRALGVAGNFVTERRKKAFLGRMEGIWGSLAGFQDHIHAWRQNWQSNMNNPAAMMQMLAAAVSGGAAAVAVSGVNDAPDAAPVVDAATAVIEDINKMFAGTGIPVARALAADAVQLRQLIERPELVSAVGAVSRDEMLKTLRLAVGADLVRAERSVAQYVLGVLELPKQPDTNLSLYIVALETLGTNIPWDKLGARLSDNGRPGISQPRGTKATY
ncbi:MAG TPA: hypothetical protein VL500_05245 [Candidatus Eisenbacteria bacterium]|nr:hypothetical protein [Candidatus Eisenbacteria bacterium]